MIIVGKSISNFVTNGLKEAKYLSAAPVAERLRALFLNHWIISPLCQVWVRA